jgi:methionyl-tRNA formyltransferase
MGDVVTGGTVFWLDGGIDRGDIERQDWCWIEPQMRLMKPSEAAAELWRNTLLPMGTRLLEAALNDVSRGVINRTRQNPLVSTFEPGVDSLRDVYRPDALMLGMGGS